jgi:hypothetical protein
MSRAKQTSDVEDMSNRQTTHGSAGPTDPFGGAHTSTCTGGPEVDHKFISLRSIAMDRKFRNIFGYSKNIKDSLHRVKFL